MTNEESIEIKTITNLITETIPIKCKITELNEILLKEHKIEMIPLRLMIVMDLLI